MRKGSRCGRLLVALAISFIAAGPMAGADSSTIPADVQLLLFRKIWMFDRSVPANAEIVVAILYQSSVRSSEEAKDRLIEAAKANGLNVRITPVALDSESDLSAQLNHVVAHVFYVTELRGINPAEIGRISRRRHIRTITVTHGYVEAGIAIGLRVRNDKPSIVVNLDAARAEGSDLSAQLLRLSTVISDPAPQ